MGYTHYYRCDGLAHVEYDIRLKDVLTLVKACQAKYRLRYHYDDEKGLVLDGAEDKTCDSFVLPPPSACKIRFGFCKTSRMPYDDVVTACLLIMSMVSGFSISSDGDESDFLKGQSLVWKHLKYTAPIYLDEQSEHSCEQSEHDDACEQSEHGECEQSEHGECEQSEHGDACEQSEHGEQSEHDDACEQSDIPFLDPKDVIIDTPTLQALLVPATQNLIRTSQDKLKELCGSFHRGDVAQPQDNFFEHCDHLEDGIQRCHIETDDLPPLTAASLKQSDEYLAVYLKLRNTVACLNAMNHVFVTLVKKLDKKLGIANK